MNRKFRLCIWSKHNGGIGNFRQVKVAAYKICMKVSLKNVFDGGFSFGGNLKIIVNITQRVYNGRFPITLYIISSFTQAARIQLFHEHRENLTTKIAYKK